MTTARSNSGWFESDELPSDINRKIQFAFTLLEEIPHSEE